jgi:hypothetical protein
MAMLAASISLAGPVRLATNFFIPAGRTNPVVLDAKADASGNLVTAALADVTGGQQIVITKFTAAGVRRWSSTINTPVPVAPAGQVAGKFQIQLDGVGNTYVLSPRAGNPVIADTTEDLIVRKISDSGATVGYLSLVGYLVETDGVKYNVTNAQMQKGPELAEEVGLAFTAVKLSNGTSSAIVIRFSGGVSAGAITVDGNVRDAGDSQVFPGFGYSKRSYSVVGLKEGLLSSNPAGKPKYRMIVKNELDASFFNQVTRSTSYQPVPIWFDPSGQTLENGVSENSLGFQAEGLGSSPDQVIVLDRHYSGSLSASRLVTSWLRSSFAWSDAPFTATRVGDDWLLYHWSVYNNREGLLKLPTSGALTGTLLPITSTGTPLYAGASILTANGRAYLAGGPTLSGVQGMYSSFNAAGELVYSAGQTQPFTLSTSIVVPTVNNRFWTVGKTSAGLQAVTLWREPDYFVGISSVKSALAGDTITVKAHLNTPAPIGGYAFNVSVSSNLQDAPRTVTVPAGESSATFTVKVKSTATAGSATVTARTNTTLDVNTAHTATFNIN